MTSKCVKVSVVMPAYNVARYIDEAIQSVLMQKGVSFELLVGDDASTDDTWNRIQSCAVHPRVRSWCFPRHLGLSAAKNQLIGRARGRYVAFCDADDVMLTGHLQTFARILDRNPKVGAVWGDLLAKDDRTGRSWIKRRYRVSKNWDLLGGCYANIGTLARRSLLLKVGGCRPELTFLEDCDLSLRLAEITRFHYVKGKPFYIHRQRAGSLSDQHKRDLIPVSQRLLRETIFRRYGVQIAW